MSDRAIPRLADIEIYLESKGLTLKKEKFLGTSIETPKIKSPKDGKMEATVLTAGGEEKIGFIHFSGEEVTDFTFAE